ncbi:hypothetical protein AVEN_113850-1 [Araneus ventricosus]|uniref:Uncharacterized protein n=1 Tax=Araneus ventricosus TaxID=182803 RepID=A0A4Y2N0P6_ARAVE|nr:hypothetical protein AVEN_113850-1 [Araneus ventricosus]
MAMRSRKCNPDEIGGLLWTSQENRRQPPAEVLGWKIGIHRDQKLTFIEHKHKISHDFPDNEFERSFTTWAPDVPKYSGQPSDVRSSHEDASFQNAPLPLISWRINKDAEMTSQ